MIDATSLNKMFISINLFLFEYLVANAHCKYVPILTARKTILKNFWNIHLFDAWFWVLIQGSLSPL